MKKALVFGGALVALVMTSAPALAVPATTNAKGKVKVLRPLQINRVQDLDLQTVVLSGAAPFTATVGVSQAGAPNCDGASGNVTCSGTMTPAIYQIKGAANQVVNITVPSTLSLANTTTTTAPSLTLNVSAPATLNLGTTGPSGTNFNIGGSISVSDTTVDGQYEGTFNVSADYQ